MVLKLIKSMVQTITRPIQHLIISYLRSLVGFPSLTHHNHDSKHDHHLTVIIQDSAEDERDNVLYAATRVYLFSKLNLYSVKFSVRFYVGECKFDDLFQGVELKWRVFVDKRNTGNISKECFELRFDEKHRDLVFDSYLPFVESKAKEIQRKKRTLAMHTLSPRSDTWETKSLDHHSTFETMVIIYDLDLFMRRKDFYRRVGRHWMRSYLLHGLPGTGKTSLVAAMAKYLNFDVYNLKLLEVMKSDVDPRRLIRGIMDSSIIVVEDIDCSLEGSTVALWQLLSFLDGYWSNGEARIVIFVTNNKERLDPALESRLHRQIYMEHHCSFEGFKTLASNYLSLSDGPHRLYPEIKRLIDGQAVTPGRVAEELMKSQDVDVALEGLVRTLAMKTFISNKIDDDDDDKDL